MGNTCRAGGEQTKDQEQLCLFISKSDQQHSRTEKKPCFESLWTGVSASLLFAIEGGIISSQMVGDGEGEGEGEGEGKVNFCLQSAKGL